MYILVYIVGYEQHACFGELGHMDRYDLSPFFREVHLKLEYLML
jgi:hypothetical protein